MNSLERLSLEHIEGGEGFLRESVRLHLERYQFAAQYVAGKRVMDLACGVGYGSALLADSGAGRVVGIDIDAGSIDQARKAYSRPNVAYLAASYEVLRRPPTRDPAALEALREPFDVVVSLETIEHVANPDDFVKAVTDRLVSGGLLVASVPVTPSMDANPYHLHDFTSRSFRRLLERNRLHEIGAMHQRQSYDPFQVRKQLADAGRTEFRQKLIAYYVAHPYAVYKRVASTLRHGFVNLVDVIAARKT